MSKLNAHFFFCFLARYQKLVPLKKVRLERTATNCVKVSPGLFCVCVCVREFSNPGPPQTAHSYLLYYLFSSFKLCSSVINFEVLGLRHKALKMLGGSSTVSYIPSVLCCFLSKVANFCILCWISPSVNILWTASKALQSLRSSWIPILESCSRK